MTYDASSSLIGYQPIRTGWQAALTARGALGGVLLILAEYDHWCQQYDSDPNLALAQACHESAWFTSELWVQEWNPAGLGITSSTIPPNPFKSPQEGIQAHIEHLLCYTHLIDDCPADHAHLADRRHFFHDGLPRLADLERLPARGWANPGTGYIASIVAIANSIGATPVSAVPTEADLGYPGQVHYATGSGETMNLADVQWFIVHDTEGGFAGSEATLSGQISAHLLIDKSGEWRFMVPLNAVAYAAGNLPVNRQSVNVEHVGFADAHDGGYTDAQYRCAAAFYRFCVANGMVNVPAVYVGKQDANGGPEPDAAGILGHMDVPRDDGKPGWGGNYGHTDPGPTYDFEKLKAYIGNAPPPPPTGHQIDGHTVGDGHYNLYASVDAAHRLIVFGTCLTDEHDEYMVIDAPADAKAKNLSKIAIPVVAVRYERQVAIWDRGRTAAPWDTRIPLTGEHVGPADDLLVGATLYAMQLVGYTP